MDIKVAIQGCDEIEINFSEDGKILKIKTLACSQTTELISKYRRDYGMNLNQWPLPTELDHSSLLLRELLLKFKNQWESPYPEEEICHCRKVSTQKVEDAIMLGARTSGDVSRLTNASTSCGSCKFDVEKLIDYRLKTNSSPDCPQ